MKNYNVFLDAVKKSLPSLSIRKNEYFKHHTSFGIGGKMAMYVEVENELDLLLLLKLCKMYFVKFFLLGNGTNILASDTRHDMLVIKLNLKEIKVRQNKIICGAGASLFSINHVAQKEGLSGLEWSYGLPASVGGAVIMNAGSFGKEMKDVVESVYYTDGYKIFHKSAKALDFSYRHSFFQDKDYVITKVVLKLERSNSDEVLSKCQDILRIRHLKQPFSMRSAGSVFKKPKENFAPYLIERCGLKGVKIGEAQVSKKHCGFIVNLKDAKFSDVFKLICKIKPRVL